MVFGEFLNFVLVPCEVGVHVPREVFGADDSAVEVELDTAVDHVTHVVVVAGEAERCGEVNGREHVGGATVEAFYRTAEACVEEVEFEADVEVGVLFPGDVGVTHRGGDGGGVAVGVYDGVGVGVAVGTDLVVTLLAVRCFELEHVHPLGERDPVFFGKNPCAAGRPEVTPAVVGVEAARTVATERYGTEVFVTVVVLSAENPAFGVVGRR